MTLREFIKLAFKDDKPALNPRLLNREVMKIAVDKLMPVAVYVGLTLHELVQEIIERRCKVCGCTQNDCRQCIKKTGSPCHWVAEDICSACVTKKQRSTKKRK